MQTKRIATIVTTVVVLALLLATSSTVAGPPVEGNEGSGKIMLAGTVASKISYQGRLTDAGGNPFSGNYNLVFQLWDDATAGSQVGGDIVRNNVSVSNGLFTVDLDVPQDAFNGQWLLPRQELLPVPYALSLRPGAWIEGNSTDPAVTVTNGGLFGTAVKAHADGLGIDALGQTGVYAQGWVLGVDAYGMVGVRGQGDIGVRGEGLTGVHGESEMGYGVVGATSAPMTATYAAGVYGQSINGRGVIGESQFDVGVYGQSSGGFGAGVGGSGVTGVFGSGGLVGVSGYTTNDDTTGVLGTATGYDGKGVEGTAQFGTGVIGTGETGVKGTSSVGPGVWGEGSIGVYGLSASGDGVQGYGTVNGVYGEASGYGGQGVFGVGKGDNAEGVLGSAEGSTGIGVYGMAAGSGDGVQGFNKATGDGVHGIAGASNKSGVYGFNTGAGYGVAGRSASGWGMEADGNDTSNSDRVGDLVLAGNIGEIFSFGHLGIYTDHDAYIDLDDDNNDANAKFVIFDGTNAFRLTVDEGGNLWASGTKSAMVQTANYSRRLLYAVESSGVWFEDFGKASLVKGEATVAFELIFAETVNLEMDYHVFLTPLCQEPVLLFVTAKSAKGFTVRGVTLNGQPTGCAFDYRIVAKRLGYEQVRLEEATWPEEGKER
ncbi:MAG: hypothetical protein WBW48_10875 [Anaerolineae bacterium]